VASSGDSGAGPVWPAVSPNVLAVGGTTLRLDSSGNYLGERGWGSGSFSSFLGGSGGGISQYETQPSYQNGLPQSTTQRLSPDVAYDANPNTGVYVRYAGRWYDVGGTSVGAPQWAALIAIADQGLAQAGAAPLSGAGQTLPAIYGLSAGDFHDVTTGNNGDPATVGFDLVTGRGSPIANLVINDLVSTGSAVAATTSPNTSTGSTVNTLSGSQSTVNALGGSNSSTNAPLAGNAKSPTAPKNGKNQTTAAVSTTDNLAQVQASQLLVSPRQATVLSATNPLPPVGSGAAAPVTPTAPPTLVAQPTISGRVELSGGDSSILPDDQPVGPTEGQPEKLGSPTLEPATKPAAPEEGPAPADEDPVGSWASVDAVFLASADGSPLLEESSAEAGSPDRTLVSAAALTALFLGLGQYRKGATESARTDRNRTWTARPPVARA
jgi:hypothetical protein